MRSTTRTYPEASELSERDILHQADALINRHRPQRAADDTDPTVEDDIPLLTEVVDSSPTGPMPDAAPDTQAAIRAALSRELETWLDERLPEAVLRVLDGLSDQMIAQVAAQARLELLPRLKRALEAKSKPE